MNLRTLLLPPTEMLWLICIYDEQYIITENKPKQKIAPGQQHKTNLLPDVILNGWDIKTQKKGFIMEILTDY